MQELVEWINSELNKRNWTLRELSRRSGVNPGTISLVLNQHRGAGPEFCRAIARAFRVSPEKVFRLAGLLPAKSSDDELREQLLYLFDQLSPAAQWNILIFADALVAQGEEQDDAEDTAASPAAAGS